MGLGALRARAQALEQLGLPKTTTDNIVFRAATAGVAAQAKTPVEEPWFAEVVGYHVLEKLPWVEPNPFLRNAAITDVEGKHYVKENPAMVTKQLSKYAQKDKLYSFHITSLNLMNPENAPDDFERSGLRAFDDKKLRELGKIEKIGGSHYYRYIAPLYGEEACLECHAKQGYKVGDIRGAISITVPVDYAFSVISADRKNMLFGGFFMVIVLMLVLSAMTGRMVISPIRKLRTFMATPAHAPAANRPAPSAARRWCR